MYTYIYIAPSIDSIGFKLDILNFDIIYSNWENDRILDVDNEKFI